MGNCIRASVLFSGAVLEGKSISQGLFLQNSLGFGILLRWRSPNNPFSGSWSVTTMTFGEPMMNIPHFANAYAIAVASPSIGAYLHSASVRNLLLAYIRRQPLGQQIRAFSIVHWQCFCKSRKPIPSLLQSGARQVTRSLSNVATPFWTYTEGLFSYLSSNHKFHR